MAKRRLFARGAGCLAGLGLSGALGIAGTLGLTGVGSWVVYRGITSQWEDALRDTLAQTTGDEITFRKMSIGLRSVTVHDLSVKDALDGEVLHIDQLSLEGDPRELLGTPTAWKLEGLHLEGVDLHPQRDGDTFALPTTTLALLRGDSPLPAEVELPQLVVPTVTVDGLRVALDGHELTAASARIADGATLVPPSGVGPFTLQLGGAELEGVALPAQNVGIDRLRLALTDTLTPTTTQLVVDGVVAEGVALTLDGLKATIPRIQAENDVTLDLLAGPSLTVGQLQSDGFSLSAGNVFHCRDLRTRIDQTLTLADDELVLDELTVTGLRSTTTPQGWPALDVLLSATDGAHLPPVRAPRVSFRQTVIGAGGAEATADTTSTSLHFVPGERLSWGAGVVQELDVTLNGAEQLAVDRVAISGGALTPGRTGLAFEELDVQGVRGASSWTSQSFGLPEGLLGLAAVRGGMSFGAVSASDVTIEVTGRTGSFPVHVDQATVHDLSLGSDLVTLDATTAEGIRMSDGAFEATVRHVELARPTTLTPGQSIAWPTVDVRGVAVGGGGKARVAVERIDVPAGTLTPATDGLAIDAVGLEGLTGTIAWGAHAFGVPEAVFRLGGFAGGVSVKALQIERTDLLVQGKTGTIPVHVDRIAAKSVDLDPDGWTVASGDLKGLEARWERVRATVDSAGLAADGTVTLTGAEAWTRLNEERKLDLPPVAADHAPVWLGGAFRGTEPYFGVAFPGSPYTPRSIQAPGLLLHLADEGIANPHTTWDLTLDVALGPHDAQGHLPVSLEGDFAGGKLAMQGHVEPAGVIQADVGVRGLVLGEMGMYLNEPMSRFNMEIQQGRGGAALRVNLEGSQVSMRGNGTGRSLKMQGSAVAGMANVGFGAVKGSDNTVSIPIEIDGDLSDPAFSPFDLLLSSYVGGLHKSVAKSLGNAVKNLGGPDDGTVRAKQTGGGRNVDKAFGAIKKGLRGGSDDAVRAGKDDGTEEEAPPVNLLDTAADTGRPEAVDTGGE